MSGLSFKTSPGLPGEAPAPAHSPHLHGTSSMLQEEPGLYRGRLAPSPTGLLHVGHARTFWRAFQRAQEASGTLVLRMDDLDPQRSRAHFAEAITEDLQWLGIAWQEGPYRQSERHALYRAAWERLLAQGSMYPCTCSRKELAQALAAPHEDGGQDAGHDEGDEPAYPGTCRPAEGVTLPAKTSAGVNWRFRVPDGEIVAFEDKNRGPQRFVAGSSVAGSGPAASCFSDFLVWRRDDLPSYQLACVVDDAAMRITEVVRGADLLKSTARQMLLNRALGYDDPAWFHCELVRDEHGQRLAKRHDALSVRALREAGKTVQQVLGIE